MFVKEEVDELKSQYPNVQASEEAGKIYFLLPKTDLPENCHPSQIDLLLCPTERDGYPSRLFFAEMIQTPKSLNWNATGVRILERNWNAFSWRLKTPNLRLIQILSLHLKALS